MRSTVSMHRSGPFAMAKGKLILVPPPPGTSSFRQLAQQGRRMNQRTDCTILGKRALHATGCLLMAVAALVHFWCCEWRVSFLSQNGEPEVSDVRRIVGPIYPKESFPGNVWDAGVAGLIIVQRSRSRRSFPCPFCRRPFTLGYSGISHSHETVR